MNSTDPRLLHFLEEDPEKASVHLWGYPDDEGIRLNKGRPGAALAPEKIRECFFKMTPGLDCKPQKFLWDAGNLGTSAPLVERHQRALEQNLESYQNKKFVCTLGGGHDYGYPDAMGFVQSFKKSKKKPVVINFDAHLDVRPLDQGLTSGTPFYRLLSEAGKDCHFIEVGIQEHCNSQMHLEWAQKHKAHVILEKQLRSQGLTKSMAPLLKKYKGHPVFLSLDIDVFSSAVAPGCSQSWPVGMEPRDFFIAWPELFKHLNVKGLGLYEVSPPLDMGVLTSRLAALILHRSLQLKGWL